MQVLKLVKLDIFLGARFFFFQSEVPERFWSQTLFKPCIGQLLLEQQRTSNSQWLKKWLFVRISRGLQVKCGPGVTVSSAQLASAQIHVSSHSRNQGWKNNHSLGMLFTQRKFGGSAPNWTMKFKAYLTCSTYQRIHNSLTTESRFGQAQSHYRQGIYIRLMHRIVARSRVEWITMTG